MLKSIGGSSVVAPAQPVLKPKEAGPGTGPGGCKTLRVLRARLDSTGLGSPRSTGVIRVIGPASGESRSPAVTLLLLLLLLLLGKGEKESPIMAGEEDILALPALCLVDPISRA